MQNKSQNMSSVPNTLHSLHINLTPAQGEYSSNMCCSQFVHGDKQERSECYQ